MRRGLLGSLHVRLEAGRMEIEGCMAEEGRKGQGQGADGKETDGVSVSCEVVMC